MTMPSRDALLRPWHKVFPPFTIGGSLYAVPGTERAATAAALAASLCRVHADIIVDEHGNHRGVTWGELADVRAAAPDARLDLHLIIPDALPGDQAAEIIREAVHAARGLPAEAVTMNAAQIIRNRTLVDAMRASGIELWLELAPSADDEGLLTSVDGAMVMFITPGTKDPADPAVLPRVGHVAARLPVGVDGGVTEPTAVRAFDNGASYIVSGRSLLCSAGPLPSDPTTKGP